MKYIFTLILSFSYILSFSQFNDKTCRSNQMKKYDDSLQLKWKNYNFIPISKEEAQKSPFNFIKIDFIEHPAKMERDSLDIVMDRYKDLIGNDFEKYMKIEDSITKIIADKKIGSISKLAIIKSERFKNQYAVLHYGFKYDEILKFGAGYWISYSSDYGKTWRDFYTGLGERNNFIFKKNSKINLWKDENHLQIESNIVRMTDEMGHPLPPEFENVSENALVTIDLSEIIKDSDNDGLSDIEEKILMLNPLSKDSDNDGIVDNIDKNPRFKSIDSPKSILFNALINGVQDEKESFRGINFEIDLKNPKITTKENLSAEEMEFINDDQFMNSPLLLVTDDKELQSISPTFTTIIILTHKEFDTYEKINRSKLRSLGYSPMFKCDTNKDTYILRKTGSYSGETYKIIRTKKGWKVKTISSWIS